MKHGEQIRHWPTPTTHAEVGAFLWLTPFLRIFTPGRAQYAIIIKQFYLEEVSVELTLASSKKSVRKKMGGKSGIHLETGTTEVV